MTDATKNIADLIREAVGPDANVTIGGELVQGTMSPAMLEIQEWRRRLEALPDDATEEEIAALSVDLGFKVRQAA